MRSLRVVDGDRLTNHVSGLIQIVGQLEQKLVLENAIDPFRQGILIAVVAVGHRTDQSVFLVNGLVLMGAVLDAAIGMMNQRLLSLAPLEGHLQGLADLGCVQAVMDVVTDDLAGVGIGDQAQVGAALPGRQIGDVGDPDLLAGFGLNLFRPRLK